ncbi:serine protease [Methylobacterium organophilum]|uniref:serine protease n=1 Tax=Methylobacterium organophilum TaxID=410 RepID=UPI003B849FDD
MVQGRDLRWYVAGLAALTLLTGPGVPMGARAQAPRPAAQPDPVFEAAKSAFEARPESERRAIQDALVWTGDYNGVTTGAFGRRSFDGLLTYQKRIGANPTGQLSGTETAALLAAGEAARKAARFSVRTDAASGIALGVPERLLPKRSAIPGGSRWQSADGRVTLDAKSAPAEGGLDPLFERLSTATPERKVTYKLKKPDFFVVTGETATGKFYLRYALGEAGIRGFSFAYDKALAADVDRLVIAVANSFTPFPDTAPAPAGPAAMATPKPTPLPAVPSLRARATATGLAVTPSLVLTSAMALEGCAAPRIGSSAATIGPRDAVNGLVLLKLEGRGAPASKAPALRADALAASEALIVLSAEPAGTPSAAPAEPAGDGVSAPLQPGSGGAPAFDRSGRLAGLVAVYPSAPRLVAGVVPPTRYRLVPAAAIGGFLTANGVTPATTAAPPARLGAAAAPYLGAVVAIACGPRG